MRECLSFLILWDPLACVIRHWNCDAWWSVCGHTPQLTVQSVAPANLGEDKWRAGESFIIEINASARGKWGDNVIITPQASCFYFSICLLSLRHASGGHMAHRLCVCACLGLPVCACVCAHTRGSKYSSENPIKGDMYWFAVLFKAFWDISTDISFNVRANGRKQTNLLLPSFLPLFPLFYLFSSLSVTLHQSLSYTAPCLHFFPLLIAMLLQDATLS